MTFKSEHPDIDLPKDLPVWTWLFDSPHSPLARLPSNEIRGFTDAITKEHISYVDVKSHTTHVSTALTKQHGLQQGDVTIIFARNSVWYPVACLAAVRVGGVACGVSPEYSVQELTYSLKLSKAKFLFTTDTGLDRAHAAASNAGIPLENVMLLERSAEGGKNKTSVQDLLETGRRFGETGQAEAYQLPPGKNNHEVCAYFGFSSGTTGLPKAVMISHANVIAQSLQIQQIIPEGHDRGLAALPFYHITGIVHQLHLPVFLNANTYVLSAFTLDRFLQTVEEYKIKELLLVPPIIIQLVRSRELLQKYNLAHVERFSCGAAPLSREILALLEKQFPGTGFKQGYGMTESCSCITAHPPDKMAYKYAHRVGTIVASTEVKIMDPDNLTRECDVSETGEIWARGPQVTMGYLNNPKATAETYDADGFLHTGDIGYIDEEGFISITDRLKELIKVKGIGVAPAELEDMLLGHRAVSDAAVCGIADDRAGERPKAFVVLAQDMTTSPEEVARELIAYSKADRARHKWIAEVEVVKEIPKSASGKILRRMLRGKRDNTGNVVVRDDTRARL